MLTNLVLIENPIHMISVEEAKELIVGHSFRLANCTANVANSLGTVLAEDILSPIDLPPFDQSAMDGYALIFDDFLKNLDIVVVGEVAAGKSYPIAIDSGKAVRIFTGAALPKGCDSVVMQENVELVNQKLKINDPNLVLGSNVRLAGSQIKKGDVALAKGSLITPGGIGYLTAMGISSVNVFSKPRISIIVTGSELQKPGTVLEAGKIFESNSFAVDAVLQSIGIHALQIISVVDDEKEIFEKISQAVSSSDMVLITGGISVGDYDFVGPSLKKIGIENIFYKIKQKPGKPMFFGKQGKTLVFGLPGNPASVLSCFYEYVYPAIRIQQGKSEVFLKTLHLPLAKSYKKKSGISFFLKGKIENGKVIPLEGQESFILSSFAIADSLIYLPAEMENPNENELVEVHLLPSL